MDRKQLENSLTNFRNKCSEINKPIDSLILEEAFPGDSSTSYFLNIKASWLDTLSSYDSLKFLYDALWETTTEEIRKNIFTIKLMENETQKELEIENV